MNDIHTPKTTLAQITDRPTSSVLFGLMAGLGLLLGAPACDRNAQPAALDTDNAAQPVRTALVETGHSEYTLRFPGVTRAVERADLAFLHGGQLAQRLVQRGQAVTVGDALAILHNPALMPGVSSAEARVREIDRQLEQLARETERLENLHERGLVSTDELDRTRSRRDALKESRQAAVAVLSEAREQLEEGTLRAPFSGRVVELHAEPGQHVAPGQPILTLIAPDRLEVAISIPVRQAGLLEIGATTLVRKVDGNAAIQAEITEIGLAEPGRTPRIIVTLPPDRQGHWSTGQAVQVELSLNSAEMLMVPMAAVISPAHGMPRVFRVHEGTVQMLPVNPGVLRNGKVSIDADLEAGDEVVVAGHGRLLDGERVRVLR